MTAKGLQKCVAHCSTAALQVRRGEDLLTADSPGIKYHPTLKFWPGRGRDTNSDKLINYPTGDLWTGRLLPAG